MVAEPLRLPPFVKRLGRAARDFRPLNFAVTSALRPMINRLRPERRDAWMKHVPRVGLASAKLPNGKQLRMFCPEPESLLNDLFYSDWRAGEPETLPIWFAISGVAEVIIDIGAHVGHFSLVAGLANPAAKIVCFEPLPRIASRLRVNLALNRIENAEVRQKALGSRTGVADFFAVADGMPSSSSLSREFMAAGPVNYMHQQVSISTLDAEKLPTNGPVLIKIDTETTEPDVIAGSAEYIRRAAPILVVEVLAHNRVDRSVQEAFEKIGCDYDAFLLEGDGPKAKKAIVADERWRNYLFVPRNLNRLGAVRTVLQRYGIG